MVSPHNRTIVKAHKVLLVLNDDYHIITIAAADYAGLRTRQAPTF